MWLLEIRSGNYTLKQKMVAMKSAVWLNGNLREKALNKGLCLRRRIWQVMHRTLKHRNKHR